MIKIMDCRWKQNLEQRGTSVDWRKGHSGRRVTVATPANIAAVDAEVTAAEGNTPWQAVTKSYF